MYYPVLATVDILGSEVKRLEEALEELEAEAEGVRSKIREFTSAIALLREIQAKGSPRPAEGVAGRADDTILTTVGVAPTAFQIPKGGENEQ